MKAYIKFLIVLGALILLSALVNLGLNLWVNHQLPKIINRENHSAYSVVFKKLNVSLWSSSIEAFQVVIVPKAALKNPAQKAGIYARMQSVKIEHFKTWDLLFRDRIKAQSIRIDRPQVLLYKSNGKAINRLKSIRKMVVAPFDQVISVPNIFLHDGALQIIYAPKNEVILALEKIDFQLDGLEITDEILNEKIPFRFRNYSVRCDRAYYKPSPFYRITAAKIDASKSDFKLKKLEWKPGLSRREFVSKIPNERDLYTVLCDSVSISKMYWGFKSDDFFFHCGKILLDKAAANIYRSKEPPDNPKKKFLYNKLLRDLKFDLRVDTLEVRQAMVQYEEEKSTETGPGKLSFSRFNLMANHICSGFKKQKLDDVRIRINCQFMKASPLAVDWRFNVMDRSDGFRIKGQLKHFDAEAIAPFTKPYLNVTTEGFMDEVNFDFTGNDRHNTGELAVKYDDLKFTFYQKDERKKKNKLLTFVSRIFVKKDTKDRLKETQIDVRRNQERSFYNLLWHSVEEGLKKILI